MCHLRLSALAVVVWTSLTNIAAAADLPARPYTKEATFLEIAYNWSGFFAGINGGGGTSSINWNADSFTGFAGGADAALTCLADGNPEFFSVPFL